MEDNKEIEIDFRKIFAMLKKKAIFIVIIAIIGATLAGCFTNFFITPQYTATVKLHAWSSGEQLIGSNNSISSSEYQASEMLVNTYLVVVKSDTFLEKVAEELGNGMKASDIKSMLSCSQISDTIAFSISITSSNAEQAANIANTIADMCPSEIVRILKVGGVEIIDYASVPSSPSSPDMQKNVAIGFLVGFAISFAFFFIRELFDTSIKDEEDLTREFSIPIIGTVPKLVAVTERVKPEQSIVDVSFTPITNSNEKEDK
jgi:capsular polysaccharide biosynthesis protein